jgi:hypothetical protein
MFTLRKASLLCATAPLWLTERHVSPAKRVFSWRPKRLDGSLASTFNQALASRTPCVLTGDRDLSRHYDFPALVKRQATSKLSVVPLGDKEAIDQLGMPQRELPLAEVHDWMHTPSKGRLFAWLPLGQMGDLPQSVPRWLGRNAIDTPMSGMFISSRGYFTRIHFDWAHGFLTQVQGKKRVTLIAPQASRHLYLNSPFSTPIPRYATQLPNRVLDAASTFTRLANAHIEQLVLCEGETLYIPPFWWHEVETLEPSAAVAIRYHVAWRQSLSARVFELLVLQVRFALLQRAAQLIIRNNLTHMLK